MTTYKTWLADTPSHCENCDNRIDNRFFDARLNFESKKYFILCPKCFESSIKLGVEYKKRRGIFLTVDMLKTLK